MKPEALDFSAADVAKVVAPDLVGLLTPVRGDSGAGGEDLDGDPEYIKLFEEINPSHKTYSTRDWMDIRTRALELLIITRDLRLGLILALASLRVGGFGGMAEALKVLTVWFEDEAITSDLKPKPVPARVSLMQRLAPEPGEDGFVTEGEYPFRSLLYIQPLADGGDAQSRTLRAWTEGRCEPVLHAIRSSTSLFSHNLVASLEGLDAAVRGLFRAFLRTIPGDDASRRERIVASQQRLIGEDSDLDRAGIVSLMRRILALAQERPDGASSRGKSTPEPSMSAVPDPRRLAEALRPEEPASQEEPKPESRSGTVPEPAGLAEAIGMLESLVRYFQTHDSTSPIPFLVLRCIRLISMDFLSAVKEVMGDKCEEAFRRSLGIEAGSFRPVKLEAIAFRDIASPGEVVAVALSVASFLDREHPSSPASFFVRRAAHLAGGRFPKLIEEMSLFVAADDLKQIKAAGDLLRPVFQSENAQRS